MRTQERQPVVGSRAEDPLTVSGPQLGVHLFEALSELLERMSRHLVAVTAGMDLPTAQARALLRLGEPTRMRALANLLRCDPSNVTGLVERRPDPLDRRARQLVLTPLGEQVRADLHRQLHGGLPGIERLTDRQRRSLLDILRTALDGA